ncbi:MAG: phosphoribosylanthranilate isomerase [Calditrichaceae bacterium]|jgi:phosphoribosylanthranilate isomerase
MHINDKPKVKICCIQSIEEARMAVSKGASAIGLVSEMPSGPGVIPERKIAEIAESVPEDIETFLLTSRQSVRDIVEQHKHCRTTTIQFVDVIKPEIFKELRIKLPHVKFVQVIHIMDQHSVEKAKFIESSVDYLLLDSGNTSLKIKKLGGTGRVHDWHISRQICETVSIPVYLAGGLNPDNVKSAIEKVKPYGVDVCSGLRTNGKLDEQKLNSFFSCIFL